MKIGSLDNKMAVAPASGERTKTHAASGTPVHAAEASTKVELSSGALLAGGSESVFDAEKVRRIAEAIRDGKFEVNAEAIADKLIANAHELLTPRSGG